jgi:hypothetical protein
MPRRLALALLAAGLLLGLLAPSASADVTIVQPTEKYAGKTYGQWSAAWWQLAANISEPNRMTLPVRPAVAVDSYTPIGTLPFDEASGVVASRTYPGIYWTHPDSGQPNEIYAMKVVGGALVEITPGAMFKRFTVTNATNKDWEDITVDDSGNLWIGDIGNNTCNKQVVSVYKVAEPDPYGAGTTTAAAVKYPVSWAGNAPAGCNGRNAESLFWYSGRPYIISKEAAPALYKLNSLNITSNNTLTKLTDLGRPAGGFGSQLASGADLSFDHSRIALATRPTRMFVYQATDPTLTGDTLLVSILGHAPNWDQQYKSNGGNMRVESVGFALNSFDVVLLSETREILFFPHAFYET